MDDIDGLDALESEAKALEQTLGSVTAMTDAFDGQLNRMKITLGETSRDLGNLERGFSGGLRKAFDGLVFDGNSLSDALSTLGTAMSNTVYNNALKPVTDHFGGLLASGVNSLVGSLSPFEKGGAFSQGRVTPFAKGGVVSGPMNFPMRGGTGLMGEAGPEAIMPLTRGADGKLGVASQGGQAVNITMNISTPDTAGFKRSQSQIAASVGRALGRGQRNR
ncbi:MAG: phage tail tape measure protein [Octadecabacter sp.]